MDSFLPRANDICFCGCLRSLAETTTNIYPLLYNWENSNPWFSDHSKELKEKFNVPNPFDDLLGFTSSIKNISKEKNLKTPLYIPTSDTNLMAAKQDNSLSKFLKFFGNKKNNKLINEVISKFSMYRFLKKNDIFTPKTVLLKKTSQFNENKVKGLNFPIVFKPNEKDYNQSFYLLANGLKAVKCSNLEELKKKIKRFSNYIGELVIQEYIPFNTKSDELPFYASTDNYGNIRAQTCAIKHLVTPKSFGTAYILGIKKAPNEIKKIAHKIIKLLNWSGPIMIEFIKHEKSGKWYVIEINGRPWLMIDFFRRVGFNFLKSFFEKTSNDDVWEPQKKDELKLHIDYSKVFFNHLKNSNLKAFEKEMDNLNSTISFTFFDPNDPNPGYAEINYNSKKYNLKEKQLLQLIEKFASF